MSLSPGTRLGRYEIRSQIGAGGMGEVYLADDTVLRRPAAIKVLTGDYSLEQERLHRFEREAYAASSLNHPGIVTIYEIGSEANLNFIATEYVEGESLRDHLRGTQLELREVVDVAMQIASALAAAHQTGIIHRDIKPENVMVRKDGYVKVLDFGLAKLALEESGSSDAEATTQLMVKTEPGRLLGTINYMSPEQARGLEVDVRTDIFSLGIILYEMVAGRRPFSGDTKSDVLAAVLTVEPDPLENHFPEIPDDFNRIINKALRKDREERYQTARELLVDLKKLRQDLEFGLRTGQPILRVARFGGSTTGSDGSTRRSAAPGKADAAPTISDLFINEVKVHPRRVLLALTAIVGLMAAAGYGLYYLLKPGPESFQAMRLTKLTFSGDAVEGQIAISPDGKYVVYVVREGDHQSLWVRQVATSSVVLIVPPVAGSFSGLTFSSDGSYVYYTVQDLNAAVLYQVPALGGPARKLVENAYGPVTFSPDGKRMAFIRGQQNLMIASIDGNNEQTLATCMGGEAWLTPAWSPDGRIIAIGLVSPSDNNTHLIEVEVKDARRKRFASPPWLRLSGLSWLPDGKGLILSGRDLETRLSQIWFLSYPDGKPRRVTNDLSSYIGVSLTGDGSSLASVQGERLANIWIGAIGDGQRPRKITSELGKDDGMSGVALTPAGKVVYTTRATGTQDLWIVDGDSSNRKQLTFNSRSNHSPSVSPDGRHIVFVSDRSGSNNIWRMDLDGANAVQLTNNPGIAGRPDFSPDSRWVVFQITSDDRKTTIWKVSIEGGTPIQLTTDESARPRVSPDGELFACLYSSPLTEDVPAVALIPLSGGLPVKVLKLPAVAKSRDFRWSADGRSLIYIDSANQIYNLWHQALNGEPPQPLTDFGAEEVFRFDVSSDHKLFALARGREGSDVILISNVR